MAKMREKYESNDVFTWTQVHNLFPIIVATIGIALAWGKFEGEMSVMRRDIQYLGTQVESLTREVRSLQGRSLSQETILNTLPMERAVNGASTTSGTLVPTPTITKRPARGITPEKTNE